MWSVRMRFNRSRANIVVLLVRSVVRGGVEPTAGDVSDRHASVTTPDRVQVGMVGVEPGHRRAAVVGSCSQGTRAAVTLHPDVVLQVRTAGLEPRPSLRDGANSP